jgi:hypothetical protein
MPRLQKVVGHLNTAMSEDRIDEFVKNRDRFAPGKRLSSALNLLFPAETPLYKDMASYIDGLPGSLQEIVRATIYYALSTDPPTLVTFAWAAGYDFELTTWQAPDTRETRGGITMLLKSRYPTDAHPVSARRSRRR